MWAQLMALAAMVETLLYRVRRSWKRVSPSSNSR